MTGQKKAPTGIRALQTDQSDSTTDSLYEQGLAISAMLYAEGRYELSRVVHQLAQQYVGHKNLVKVSLLELKKIQEIINPVHPL